MAFLQVQRCFSEPKQLVKLILLTICVFFTISQLTECVRKMLHPPVSTHYKFFLNDTIKYPSVTICRRPAYKTKLFSKYGMAAKPDFTTINAFLNFDFEKYTIAGFLEETTYRFQDVFTVVAYATDGRGTDLNITSNFFLTYGRCFTITPLKESDVFTVSGGYWFYVKHNILKKVRDNYGVSESGFQIYLHDSNEVLTEEIGLLEYLYLESGEEMRIALKVQVFQQVSTSDEPCNEDPSYSKSKCIEECVHLQIAKEVNCTVPWLHVPSGSFEQCASYASVRSLVSLISPSSTSRKEMYMKNCKCMVNCKISVYNTNVVSKKDIDKELIPDSMITIYYPTNLVTLMTEIISYDWNIFIADIGGSLGFLLGLSVLGLLAALEEISHIAFRFWKRKNKVEEGEKKDEEKIEEEDVDGAPKVDEEEEKKEDKFNTMIIPYYNSDKY